MTDPTTTETRPTQIVHRLALLIVCLVWPLIWVGGLVTTYDAGMAVPDWPNTYGYNLFLYPYQTWLLGPYDLFIEHGHRLLGAVVGFVAIGIVFATWKSETRRWVLGFSVAMLVAVIFQGLLGGIRVVRASRTLAMVHGCFGPAFFASCAAFAVVTSKFWRRNKNQAGLASNSEPAPTTQTPSRRLWILAASLVGVSYLQLILGAMLRHSQPTTPPGVFTMIVAIHVLTAFLLWLLVAVSWTCLRRCGDLTLSRPCGWLVGLVAVQILLGTATWIVNYGWPGFMKGLPGSTGFVIQAKGFWESLMVTGHVATGSLILAISTMIWVRVWRRRYSANQNAALLGDDRDNLDEISSQDNVVPQPTLT